jgi:hypothetical protein
MWTTTGDVKWRERGYGIFQAIEKYARTRFGYTSTTFVESTADMFNNLMICQGILHYIIYYIIG